MKNLTAAFTGKTLGDLKVDEVPSGSNLIEPTKAEIVSILVALKEGKSPIEIKQTIRRNKNGAKLGFSFGQIKEIAMARDNKIAELTPKGEEVN